jgi:hypothetical protein
MSAADQIVLPAYQATFPGTAKHFGIADDGKTVYFYSNGAVAWTANAPKAGKYRLAVIASCKDAAGDFAEFVVKVAGTAVGKPVTLKSTERDDYGIDVVLPKGKVKIAIAFTNDKYSEGEYDRNLFVHKVVLTAR